MTPANTMNIEYIMVEVAISFLSVWDSRMSEATSWRRRDISPPSERLSLTSFMARSRTVELTRLAICARAWVSDWPPKVSAETRLISVSRAEFRASGAPNRVFCSHACADV